MIDKIWSKLPVRILVWALAVGLTVDALVKTVNLFLGLAGLI